MEYVTRKDFDATNIVKRYPPAGVGLVRAHEVTISSAGRTYVVLEYQDKLAVRYPKPITNFWDLMKVKEAIWGNRFAVEVFPPMEECIDLAHTRHLWGGDEVEKLCSKISEKLHKSLEAK